MKLIKIILSLLFFATLGLFADEGPTVKNMFNGNIKVFIVDNKEKIFERYEVSNNSSVKMTRCTKGKILYVTWGEMDTDGYPKSDAVIMDNCNLRINFTPNKKLEQEKQMNLNKFKKF